MFNIAKPNLRPRNILITGASSGIGASLAQIYAELDVTLNLLGRDDSRLSQTSDVCEAKQAKVLKKVIDVTDADGMRNHVKEVDAQSPLDLVVANAGVARNHEDSSFSREIIQTNIIGTLNTIEPAIELMRERQAGQIAIISSLAAFRVLGGPPGYAASKAWGRLYGEAMRGRLAKYGVAVNVVCPDFVKTPMTEKSGMDGMSSLEAAQIIKQGLSENRSRICFPSSMAAQTWWLFSQPSWWTDRKILKKWKAATQSPH